MNLCTNAGHAMRENGGILTISLADVVLDGRLAAGHLGLEPGTYLRLTVGDTGEGISAGVIDRIFDPFFTTKEKGVGTGLGLSVVHGIVKSHEGAITVASEPDQGTVIQVYLPVIERMANPEIKPVDTLASGNERILYVDDEKPIADLGKGMLERFGYKVTTRTGSIEALELFTAQPDNFDLLITDLTMPNMTGKQLVKEVLQLRPDMPIIICTGFSEIITPETAEAIGIRALLMKPLAMFDLAQSVRQLLDERPSHPSADVKISGKSLTTV